MLRLDAPQDLEEVSFMSKKPRRTEEEANPTVEQVVRAVLRKPPPKEWEYMKRGADRRERKPRLRI